MRIKRTVVAVMALLISAVAPLAGGPTPAANAAYPTCASPLPGGSYLDGASSPPDASLFGIRAQIDFHLPPLCSGGGSNTWSAIWVMASSVNPGNRYAQAGYINVGGTSALSPAGVHYFSQWIDLNGNPQTKIWGTTASGSHKYQVYRDSSDHLLHMAVDSTLLDKSNYSPDSPNWSAQWYAEFFAETNYYGTDVPGVAGDHAWLTNIAKYDVNGNQSFYIPSAWGTQNDVPSRYAYATGPTSGVTSTWVSTWTYN